MTALTEFKTALFQRKRLCSIRFIVALVAHAVFDRCMDIICQNRSGTRAVWIVAGGAAFLFNGIIHVAFLEPTAVGLVTAEA